MSEDIGLGFRLSLFSFLSVESIQRLNQLVVGVFLDGRVELLGNVIQLHHSLGLADFFLNVFDKGADLFDFLVAEHNRPDHLLVGHFLGARLDHENGVLGPRERKVDRALFLFRNGGIDDVFTVQAADDDRSRRSRPGNIGNGQRNGRTDHGDGFGRDIGIDRKRGGDDDDVVENSLGEKGTDGTVDEAADEDRLIRRSALSLFEAAGDFAHGKHLFFVIDGQREEIHSFSGLFRHTYRDVDHRVPATHEAGAVGLLGIFADFHDQLPAGIVRFEYLVVV